ncbi:MAG: family 1 glycosylhydrolase [Candidatus Ozemobacteraceae bacterium]
MQRHYGLGILLVMVLAAFPIWAGGPTPNAAFPAGFWWGTALSAHSVEGGHMNDWCLWESMPGHISDGSNSGPACNHWELFAEDHAWMKKLGQNAVLMSIEWSRIEPMRGVYDAAAVEHYRMMLTSLRNQGIEPVVILCDRTFPTWTSGRLDTPGHAFDFFRYAEYAAKAFGDLVDYWIPVRDPIGMVARVYKDGIYPPGRVDPTAYGKAVINMTAIHRGVAALIHEKDTVAANGKCPAQVGVLVGMRLTRPNNRENPADVSLAQASLSLSSNMFLESIMRADLFATTQPAPQPGPKGTINNGATNQNQCPSTQPQVPVSPYAGSTTNFIICAYNGLDEVKFNLFKALGVEHVVPPGCVVDEAGQTIFPAGLPTVLASLKRFSAPLYVMIGIADATGARRGKFLIDHARQVRSAILQGCDVRGIFYNSLLSGFEFERGYSLKRGLLNVNIRVQERKPAPGADVFRALATSNGSDETPRPMQRPNVPKASSSPEATSAPDQTMEPQDAF